MKVESVHAALLPLFLVGLLAACSQTDMQAVDASATADGGGGQEASAGSSDVGAGPTEDASDEGTTDLRSCTQATDCTLRVVGCCLAYWTVENFTAVRTDAAAAFDEVNCPKRAGVMCDASLVPTGGLLPACVAGQCAVAVLANSPISDCTTDQDCVAVQCGLGECNPYNGAVGIGKEHVSAYQALMCGALQAFECDPKDAGSAKASCGANGHCGVVFN